MASDLVRGKDGGPAPMASTMVRDVVGDKRLFLQYIRIALFRGLFRVTDMNPTTPAGRALGKGGRGVVGTGT